MYISRVFNNLFIISDTHTHTHTHTHELFFLSGEASAYLSLTHTRLGRVKKRGEAKRTMVVTTVCPIREEAPTVMRCFLTYAYRHKAPLVRDLRAGKTRCSRIRVFVDRANDYRCIHIQNHVHRLSPSTRPHSFPSNFSLCAEVLQDIQDVPELPSFLSITILELTSKQNTRFDVRIIGSCQILEHMKQEL